MCVCVSVENHLEREIAYSVDFFQSQVPRTKRYTVYNCTIFENACQMEEYGIVYLAFQIYISSRTVRRKHVWCSLTG